MKIVTNIVFILAVVLCFFDVSKDNFWIKLVVCVPALIIFHFALQKYLEYKKVSKLLKNWTKLRKAYEKEDYGTIKKVIPKIRKVEDDPVLKLIEAEIYLLGKTVFQDDFKAIMIYEEINKIKLPEKTKWEKNEYTKKYAEKTKKAKKKKKKEDYLKKIKKRAIDIWNDNNLSEVKNRYHRILHTEEPIQMKQV